MSDKNIGSSLDGFLHEEGLFEETQAQAIKAIIAWHISGDEIKWNFKSHNSYPAKSQRDAG